MFIPGRIGPEADFITAPCSAEVPHYYLSNNVHSSFFSQSTCLSLEHGPFCMAIELVFNQLTELCLIIGLTEVIHGSSSEFQMNNHHLYKSTWS